MREKRFNEYTMRDDFEYHVYVATKLETMMMGESNTIFFIPEDGRTVGVIVKKKGIVTIDLSHNLIDSESNSRGIIKALQEAQNKINHPVLYATTWKGDIQFVIRDYQLISGTQLVSSSYNSLKYDVVKYQIADMSISSQFMLSEPVYQATFYFDYLHEWFSLYPPKSIDEFPELSSLEIRNISFDNETFSLFVQGNAFEKYGTKELVYSSNTSVVVVFQNEQSRDYVLNLAFQLRNFFQFLLHKELGLYQIILNKNRSLENHNCKPLDERENWIIAQSYLPDNLQTKNIRFEVNYDSVKDDFESILKCFLINKKLQDFVSRYLAVTQYKMPITPVLLTLCSGVETYLNGATFANGRKVSDFKKKLNWIFNGTWDENPQTSQIIDIIKDNRDYYIHGEKVNKSVSEKDLIPILVEFSNSIRDYLLMEMKIRKKT